LKAMTLYSALLEFIIFKARASQPRGPFSSITCQTELAGARGT
jgi:hypothetical protein